MCLFAAVMRESREVELGSIGGSTSTGDDITVEDAININEIRNKSREDESRRDFFRRVPVNQV